MKSNWIKDETRVSISFARSNHLSRQLNCDRFSHDRYISSMMTAYEIERRFDLVDCHSHQHTCYRALRTLKTALHCVFCLMMTIRAAGQHYQLMRRRKSKLTYFTLCGRRAYACKVFQVIELCASSSKHSNLLILTTYKHRRSPHLSASMLMMFFFNFFFYVYESIKNVAWRQYN